MFFRGGVSVRMPFCGYMNYGQLRTIVFLLGWAYAIDMGLVWIEKY